MVVQRNEKSWEPVRHKIPLAPTQSKHLKHEGKRISKSKKPKTKFCKFFFLKENVDIN